MQPQLDYTAVSRSENNFYFIVSLMILSVVLVGFGPQYFLKVPFEPSSVPVHIHFHSLVFTGWILLFIFQIRLAGLKKLGIHKKLGYLSIALAVLMFFLGLLTALKGAVNGHNPGGPFPDEFGFMIVSFGDISIFLLFFILALLYRKKPDYHKRWMLLATIGGLVLAPISRLPYAVGQFPIIMAVFISMMLISPIFDLIHFKKIHPANIWGPIVIILSVPMRTFIGMTDAWHQFAVWMVGLV
jgi:hypothetical protein